MEGSRGMGVGKQPDMTRSSQNHTWRWFQVTYTWSPGMWHNSQKKAQCLMTRREVPSTCAGHSLSIAESLGPQWSGLSTCTWSHTTDTGSLHLGTTLAACLPVFLRLHSKYTDLIFTEQWMLRNIGKETNCAGRCQNGIEEMYVTNHTDYSLQPQSLHLHTCSKKITQNT